MFYINIRINILIFRDNTNQNLYIFIFIAITDTINNVYGVPVVAAVRFCRVLLCYGEKSVAQKLNNLKIVQRIISYITCDAR